MVEKYNIIIKFTKNIYFIIYEIKRWYNCEKEF